MVAYHSALCNQSLSLACCPLPLFSFLLPLLHFHFKKFTKRTIHEQQNNTDISNNSPRACDSMSSPFSAVGAAAGAQLSAHIAQQERPLKLSPPQSFYDYQHDLRKQTLQPQPKPRPNPRPNPRPLQTIQPVYHVKGEDATILKELPLDPDVNNVGGKDCTIKEGPSFDPTKRNPISYACPSNWKEKEHSKALLASWVSLTEAERSFRSSENFAGPSETEQVGENRSVIDLGQKLHVVEDGMRFAFPTLGLGRERLSKEWIEYVLGREGVEPFFTSEWRNE